MRGEVDGMGVPTQKSASYQIGEGENEEKEDRAEIMRRTTRRNPGTVSSDPDAAQPSQQSLAAKVDWLFEHAVNPATGKTFTLYAVRCTRSAVRDRLCERGITVSANTIRNLRVGTVTHPSWYLVEGLACVFQTPLGFFSSDPSIPELEQQFAALTLLKSNPYWTLAQRVSRLSPAGNAAVLAITEVALEQIQAFEMRS